MSTLKSRMDSAASNQKSKNVYSTTNDDDKPKPPTGTKKDERDAKRLANRNKHIENKKKRELNRENKKKTPSGGKLKGRASGKAREEIVTKSIKAKRAERNKARQLKKSARKASRTRYKF